MRYFLLSLFWCAALAAQPFTLRDQAFLYSKQPPLRLTVTVNNGSNTNTLTNYQVKVPIASQTYMQADFGDVRFYNSDDRTPLSYWMESKTNSSAATFWVKIPSVTASGTNTIYLRYGWQGATTRSDGDATMEFFDDFITYTNFTKNIASIDTLGYTGSTVLTTNGVSFGALLLNTDGEIVKHGDSSWMLTAVSVSTNWVTYAQELNLSTLAIGQSNLVKSLDTNSDWAIGHMLMQVSPTNYVMFYAADFPSTTNRYVRAAFSSHPTNTFTRDASFQITNSLAWEMRLESNPRWVKISETSTNVDGWIGYYSLMGSTNALMGYAEVLIDKVNNTVSLVQKKATNPMDWLVLGNATKAAAGGAVDTSIRFNGNYGMFYYVVGPGTAYVESTTPTFDAGTITRNFFFQYPPYAGSQEEFWHYTIQDGRFLMFTDEPNGGGFVNYYNNYQKGTNWIKDPASGTTNIAPSWRTFETNSIVRLRSIDSLLSKPNWHCVPSFNPNVAFRTRLAMAGMTNGNIYFGMGDSYRDAATNSFWAEFYKDGLLYWRTTKAGSAGTDSSLAGVNPTNWNVFDMTWNTNRIDWYLNDTNIGNKTTLVPTNALNIRIQEALTGTAYFDWVAIRKFYSPEPTVAVAP